MTTTRIASIVDVLNSDGAARWPTCGALGASVERWAAARDLDLPTTRPVLTAPEIGLDM